MSPSLMPSLNFRSYKFRIEECVTFKNRIKWQNEPHEGGSSCSWRHRSIKAIFDFLAKIKTTAVLLLLLSF